MYLLTIGADTFTRPGRSRPVSPGSQRAQHSLGGQRTKNFFWHISMNLIHKSAQTKMRKDKAGSTFPHFPHVTTCALMVCPGLTLTQPGSGSAQFPVLASQQSSAPLGKTDPSLGSCPNLFLGYVFARLASARTLLSSSHQPSS